MQAEEKIRKKNDLTGILSECVTKLGKSKASQISVDKLSDDSGGKKTLISILSECITKLGKSTASQISVNKISDD